MTPGPAIHLTVGVSATVAAAVTGPRKWAADTPCNMAYAAAGAGILWAGCFAFNGASALAAEGIAALAVANTLFAGYAGGLGWLITNRQTGNIAILDTMVGGIAGRGSSRRPSSRPIRGNFIRQCFSSRKTGLARRHGCSLCLNLYFYHPENCKFDHAAEIVRQRRGNWAGFVYAQRDTPGRQLIDN